MARGIAHAVRMGESVAHATRVRDGQVRVPRCGKQGGGGGRHAASTHLGYVTVFCRAHMHSCIHGRLAGRAATQQICMRAYGRMGGASALRSTAHAQSDGFAQQPKEVMPYALRLR